MKGKIATIEHTTVTIDGKPRDKYNVTFAGDEKNYEIWTNPGAVGDEIEGDVAERKWNDKTFYKFTIKKSGGGKPWGGGGNQSKDESFACAYAKDLAVALINSGLIKSSTDINATLETYYQWFITKLKSK